MCHGSLQVNCAKLYSNCLYDGCCVHNYVKGIKSTRLNFLVIVHMQFPYFSDPSHDTEAYRELMERWGDGLCHPHKKRHDFFCHEKGNLLGFPIKTSLGFPNTFVCLIFIYYFPPIIYMTVVSIRFYGAKNWLNGVLGNPAYFILPVTTCLSFYEKTNSYQIGTEENGRKEEPMDQRESSQGEPVQNKVMKQTVSESNIISFDDKEETKTNVSTSMEMTYSVSQSNMLYGYYMCLTTLLLSASFFNRDCKYPSFFSLRQILLISLISIKSEILIIP